MQSVSFVARAISSIERFEDRLAMSIPMRLSTPFCSKSAWKSVSAIGWPGVHEHLRVFGAPGTSTGHLRTLVPFGLHGLAYAGIRLIMNVAVDSKNARNTASASAGSFTSSSALVIRAIHLSRAACPIANGPCRIRSLGCPRCSIYLCGPPNRNTRKSRIRFSAPARSFAGYIGPRISSPGTWR